MWAELIGTFFLTMTVKLTLANGMGAFAAGKTSLSLSLSPLLAIFHTHTPTLTHAGFVLMVLVFNLGFLSQAHFNPGVTMAAVIRNSPSFPSNDYIQIAGYWLHQLIGGLLGGMMASAIGGHQIAKNYIQREDKPLGGEYDGWNVFFAEFFFSALLATSVLHCVYDKRQGLFFPFFPLLFVVAGRHGCLDLAPN